MTGEEIRALRRLWDLSQAQLAAMLGVSKSYVARMEMAAGPNCRLVPDTIARLMGAYARGYRPSDWPRGPHPCAPKGTPRLRNYIDNSTVSGDTSAIATGEQKCAH